MPPITGPSCEECGAPLPAFADTRQTLCSGVCKSRRARRLRRERDAARVDLLARFTAAVERRADRAELARLAGEARRLEWVS
ncbi:MAG TPA: hypothetical protein VNR17_10130 [Luteimicrobium sp.]|nr:hypothetical protein [Luteimicrobium sp.]